MKVKTELLQAFMQKNELSAAILAREMGVTVGEVEKLLYITLARTMRQSISTGRQSASKTRLQIKAKISLAVQKSK